jgi:hypothetical protein
LFKLKKGVSLRNNLKHMNKKTRSFTLDTEVLDRIAAESKEIGLSTNAFLNTALRSMFGLQTKEALVAIRFNNTIKQVPTNQPIADKIAGRVRPTSPDAEVTVDLSQVEKTPARELSGRRELKPFQK